MTGHKYDADADTISVKILLSPHRRSRRKKGYRKWMLVHEFGAAFQRNGGGRSSKCEITH